MKMLCVLALALVTAACGAHREAGALEVRVYGESFIEETLPASEFVDGWAVTFMAFLVAVEDIAVHGEDEAVRDATSRVLNLAENSDGAGHLAFAASASGGLYDQVAFAVRPATPRSVAANTTAAQLAFMQDNAYALYVQGSAEKDAATLSFAWGFQTSTRYAACAIDLDIDGDVGTTTLTLHADHLFYDDLFSESPNVAFDLIAAADTDADGDITIAELRAQRLATLERYQVGSTGIDNLYDYIAYQTSTLGHIDGEGHCDSSLRE